MGIVSGNDPLEHHPSLLSFVDQLVLRGWDSLLLYGTVLLLEQLHGSVVGGTNPSIESL